MKHEDVKEDKKMIKQMVKKEALKGMKKGGPTSMDRKKYGKNLSRAMNQKSSGRGR